MAKTIAADPSWKRFGEIASLLQLAADQLWSAADAAGVDSPLHALGLGSFLVASQAATMLPAGGEVPDHPPSRGLDPLRVLEVVEQMTRQLDPGVEGASDLSLAVADLVREARSAA